MDFAGFIKPQEVILCWITVLSFIIFAVIASHEKGRYSYGVNPYKYLFSPMPPGTFSPRQPYAIAAIWMTAILCLLGFGWVAINIPEYTTLALIYDFAVMLAGLPYLLEYIDPEGTEVTGVMVLGYGDWDEQTLYGLLIGIAFTILSLSMKTQFQVNPFRIEGMVVGTFIVTVLMIPMAEETLFRGLLAASIAEKAGVVHGALVSAFVYAMFHVYAYGYSLPSLTIVFAFGVVVALIDYKYKSVHPGVIAHSFVSFVMFLQMMG